MSEFDLCPCLIMGGSGEQPLRSFGINLLSCPSTTMYIFDHGREELGEGDEVQLEERNVVQFGERNFTSLPFTFPPSVGYH